MEGTSNTMIHLAVVGEIYVAGVQIGACNTREMKVDLCDVTEELNCDLFALVYSRQ